MRPTQLSGHNDHRIVMALAVAAIASGLPALLCGAEAVEKAGPHSGMCCAALVQKSN